MNKNILQLYHKVRTKQRIKVNENLGECEEQTLENAYG